MTFFSHEPLRPLVTVGLAWVRLGPSPAIGGGGIRSEVCLSGKYRHSTSDVSLWVYRVQTETTSVRSRHAR